MSNYGFISMLIVPLSLIIIMYGWCEVEKVKKPRVVILHVHKEEVPLLKLDEDDWKEFSAEEVS